MVPETAGLIIVDDRAICRWNPSDGAAVRDRSNCSWGIEPVAYDDADNILDRDRYKQLAARVARGIHELNN